MQVQAEWLPLVVIGVFVLLFLLVAIAALRKARRRRREELRESTAEEVAARAEQARLLEATEPEALPAERPASEEPAATPPVTPLGAEPSLAESATEPAPSFAAPAPSRKQPDETLRRGLARTSSSLRERLGAVFGRHPTVDPALLDELEEVLLTADVGVGMTTRLVEAVRAEMKMHRIGSANDMQEALKAQMLSALQNGGGPDPLTVSVPRPRVILFVGVNGVGKTTTIGKIAALARRRGLEVVLAAGDTFRAAAVEQLAIWGERTKSRLIRGETDGDPASVIFNAITHAAQTHADLVLADTAGRLHTKTQLMDEIKKVKRSAAKARAGAPDETWLVVDATTGQNALQQAREFHQALALSGIILTKLDGTAKGGVVLAIADALHLPVRFVGVGEQPEDLRPFEAESFVAAMFP